MLFWLIELPCVFSNISIKWLCETKKLCVIHHPRSSLLESKINHDSKQNKFQKLKRAMISFESRVSFPIRLYFVFGISRQRITKKIEIPFLNISLLSQVLLTVIYSFVQHAFFFDPSSSSPNVLLITILYTSKSWNWGVYICIFF